MEFREMRESDAEFVANHSTSRNSFKLLTEDTDFSYALEHEGNILCVGGIRLITPTVAWTWFEFTHFAGSHVTIVYRAIKDWRDNLCKLHGIQRLQAYVDIEFPEAIRMAQHLGFHRESLMENFIGDKPAAMYVYFPGGK